MKGVVHEVRFATAGSVAMGEDSPTVHALLAAVVLFVTAAVGAFLPQWIGNSTGGRKVLLGRGNMLSAGGACITPILPK